MRGFQELHFQSCISRVAIGKSVAQRAVNFGFSDARIACESRKAVFMRGFRRVQSTLWKCGVEDPKSETHESFVARFVQI